MRLGVTAAGTVISSFLTARGLWSFVDEAGPDTQQLMAGAVLCLLPVLVLYLILQKHFTTTLVTSGLKG